MKYYIECFPGEKPSENTELFECPSCGAVCPYGHCSHGGKLDDGWPEAKMVVKVFDHHGELKDSPPACQQVWEFLKDGEKVERGDEVILPKNVDADALLAWGMLEQAKEGFELEDLEILEKLVPEVAAADLGRGMLSSPHACNLRKHVIATKKMGETATYLVWLGKGDVEKFDEAWGYASAIVERQERDNDVVLLPCGYGISVLQRGNAKLVKASEAAILVIPFLDREGKQAYSISSPNPGGADLAPVLAALDEVELGWGGRAMSGGILGDPKPGHTKLTLAQIINVCTKALDDDYSAYLAGELDPRD